MSLDAARAAFPAIPGVKFPAVINDLSLPHFGADFGSTGGRLAQLPPTLGGRYQLFVPRPDSDGLDVGGIRPLEVAAPTATLTGWAVRAQGRREGDLCGLSGTRSFAMTKGARGERRPAAVDRRAPGPTGIVKAVGLSRKPQTVLPRRTPKASRPHETVRLPERNRRLTQRAGGT